LIDYTSIVDDRLNLIDEYGDNKYTEQTRFYADNNRMNAKNERRIRERFVENEFLYICASVLVGKTMSDQITNDIE